MAATVGIETEDVLRFMAEYLWGNPEHGVKLAAAEHFGVSQAAISYHVRKIRQDGIPQVSLSLSRFEPLIDIEG